MTARRRLWLVDGYNVLRVSLSSEASPEPGPDLGPGEPPQPWWSESRRQALLELAAGLDDPEAEVRVVFDARHLQSAVERAVESAVESRVESRVESSEESPGTSPAPPATARAPTCVFAPSADDWILRTLRDEAGRWAEVRVVTADRPLADRARSRGAVVVATGGFVRQCRAGRPDR